MSQREFGALIGTDRHEIIRIEKGQRCPDWFEKAIRLNHAAKMAGVTMEDLMLSLPDPNSDTSEVKP